MQLIPDVLHLNSQFVLDSITTYFLGHAKNICNFSYTASTSVVKRARLERIYRKVVHSLGVYLRTSQLWDWFVSRYPNKTDWKIKQVFKWFDSIRIYIRNILFLPLTQ